MKNSPKEPPAYGSLPTVRELMDKSFVKLSPDMSVHEAIAIMMKKNITGAAVVDAEDQVVGILSEKDCLKTLLTGAYDRSPLGRVSDYMTKIVMTIEPDIDILDVTQIFLKQVYRRLLVVENGKIVGQITRRDVLRSIQKIIKDTHCAGMSHASEPDHQTGISFRPHAVNVSENEPYRS